MAQTCGKKMVCAKRWEEEHARMEAADRWVWCGGNCARPRELHTLFLYPFCDYTIQPSTHFVQKTMPPRYAIKSQHAMNTTTTCLKGLRRSKISSSWTKFVAASQHRSRYKQSLGCNRGQHGSSGREKNRSHNIG